MNGNKQNLTYLMEGKKTRFIIPVYQRNYDWRIENCARLFDDLVEVVKTGREEHFFGSIVSQTPHGDRVLIDGQQRVTTVFLLLAAIRRQLRDGKVAAEEPGLADDIEDDYLIDKRHRREQKLRLKLIKSDSAALEAVLADVGGERDASEPRPALVMESNVTQNYLYFLGRVESMDVSVEDLMGAIESLCVIDITLDPTDDAQLIFESLNSTGLDLSEADKVRNFVLMNLDQGRQEEYYDGFWNPIELNTDYQVSDFIRFYLAAVEGKTPAIKKVYPAFRAFARKRYHDGEAGELGIDAHGLLADMLVYSGHCRNCIHPATGSPKVDRALRNVRALEANVAYPYLLGLLEYRRKGLVDDDGTAAILGALDSYVFRRWVCNIQSAGLNKIFETLQGEAEKAVAAGADYVDAVKYLLTHKGGTGRFPDDAEFSEAVATRDFYRIGNRKLYLYDRLENGDSKERVEVAEGLLDGTFSVEHVMPQTPSDAWKASLGPDWERVHATWLHRMANLTITAYNSDYSNRPFEQKRDMRDGLRASGFRLNQWIASQNEWGEEQLKERSERLVRQFLATWPMPASSYVPQSAIPDEAALDSDVEFTGRRLTAFSFMGARYPAKQWNTMVGMVMGLVAELEPSAVYSLVAGTTYPASLFRAHSEPGYTEFHEGAYVKTASSTIEKIDLLRRVFDLCGIDQGDLVFEMVPEDEE